ncbi:hypothetical protein Lal_00038924 [Lupinus albus]|uniref:Putative ribosomal protein L34Ae n=1 Tax=Lupinus albus TaxID=3870 RepID=A0A6A4NQG6_LUPAL|nr:putative ribosomal protein L34Ae [Lupinus albus]KAF1882278.1 hypothetical protein Lal_00038924 [Lupinus albus]
MHHHLIFATTMPSSAAATLSPPPSSNPKLKSSSHSHLCNHHSPSATLDLLILLLVLFSATFLLSSYFSYIFSSLSLLSQSYSSFPSSSYLIPFLLFFLFSFIAVTCCSSRSRKCERRGCMGLKKSMEFDLQLQTEESIRIGSSSGFGEIDKLPWKGGSEGNPDYECLRAELRKMAPPNGRAILLFRSLCGCPIAKLEGWGSKKGKRHKRSSPNVSLNGRGDNG